MHIGHNGFLEQARKLIDVAADAKADAVKFQKKRIMGEKDEIARISTKAFARMVGKISGEVYCHCWRQRVGRRCLYMELIEMDPEVCGGKPILKGTRITVKLILEVLANGWTIEDIMEEYELTREQIIHAIKYAESILEKVRAVKL